MTIFPTQQGAVRHPEVLLALAAVLIVVAGPVMHAANLTGPVPAGISVLLLLTGLVLSATAAWQLIRDLD